MLKNDNQVKNMLEKLSKDIEKKHHRKIPPDILGEIVDTQFRVIAYAFFHKLNVTLIRLGKFKILPSKVAEVNQEKIDAKHHKKTATIFGKTVEVVERSNGVEVNEIIK
jgi:hypothetical protein